MWNRFSFRIRKLTTECSYEWSGEPRLQIGYILAMLKPHIRMQATIYSLTVEDH